MWICLSYPLSPDTPVPPGLPAVRMWPHSSMESGDLTNTLTVEFNNHCGTHVDAPRHFIADGAGICDLPLEAFCFSRPLLVEAPKPASALIAAADLCRYARRLAQADLLLIRTGFGLTRRGDPATYAAQNPGLSIEAAGWLVESAPRLRGLGLDTISAAAQQHLAQGIEAHRILLGRGVLLFEDLNLDFDLRGLRRVLAFPLFIAGADSAPCTVAAEVRTRGARG